MTGRGLAPIKYEQYHLFIIAMSNMALKKGRPKCRLWSLLALARAPLALR